MAPRQMRETFRPVEPRLTYCILYSFECGVSPLDAARSTEASGVSHLDFLPGENATCTQSANRINVRDALNCRQPVLANPVSSTEHPRRQMDPIVEAPHGTKPAASRPSAGTQNSCKIDVNGFQVDAVDGEYLIEAINRSGINVPHVCYHTRLGPIQACDTCMVEVNGKLVRGCATKVAGGMTVVTETPAA